MKKIKFVVAVVGITLATFGNVSNANARKAEDSVRCVGGGHCGSTSDGNTIEGSVSHNN